MTLNRSPEFCLKLMYRYVSKAGYVPGDIWGGPILAQGHNLNTLGRGHLGLMVYDKKIFPCFPLYNPRGGAVFGHRGII